jgi:hypothetical protein
MTRVPIFPGHAPRAQPDIPMAKVFSGRGDGIDRFIEALAALSAERAAQTAHGSPRQGVGS